MTFARRPAIALALLAAVLFAACGDDGASEPQPPSSARGLPAVSLTVSGEGGRRAALVVEVAATQASRERGLMFRDSLAEGRGMLFLFAMDQAGGFWMKDTRIPLTIAYLDSDGGVLELRDGVPFDTVALLPQQPYRYALEVNRGWFERHGLGPGDRVDLPHGLPDPE